VAGRLRLGAVWGVEECAGADDGDCLNWFVDLALDSAGGEDRPRLGAGARGGGGGAAGSIIV
jgi:hypothetical protein